MKEQNHCVPMRMYSSIAGKIQDEHRLASRMKRRRGLNWGLYIRLVIWMVLNNRIKIMYHGDIKADPCSTRWTYWGMLESRSAGKRSLVQESAGCSKRRYSDSRFQDSSQWTSGVSIWFDCCIGEKGHGVQPCAWFRLRNCNCFSGAWVQEESSCGCWNCGNTNQYLSWREVVSGVGKTPRRSRRHEPFGTSVTRHVTWIFLALDWSPDDIVMYEQNNLAFIY
jgi:hypothetical protein